MTTNELRNLAHRESIMQIIIVWQGAGFYQRTVQAGAIFLRFVYDRGRCRQLGQFASTQYISAIPWLVDEVRFLS